MFTFSAEKMADDNNKPHTFSCNGTAGGCGRKLVSFRLRSILIIFPIFCTFVFGTSFEVRNVHTPNIHAFYWQTCCWACFFFRESFANEFKFFFCWKQKGTKSTSGNDDVGGKWMLKKMSGNIFNEKIISLSHVQLEENNKNGLG